MGEVEEVRWKMKMGQKNNKEEIEVERLTVSFLGERKRTATGQWKKQIIYQNCHCFSLVVFYRSKGTFSLCVFVCVFWCVTTDTETTRFVRFHTAVISENMSGGIFFSF